MESSSALNVAFPIKLRAMLEETATEGLSHIVSWEMEGSAFRVHDPEEFMRQVMGRWFNQTKYKSFQRQLNLYGFCRVSRGPQKGCYIHEKFVRDRPDWTETINRKKVSDEELSETELIRPSWLPDTTRDVLEPTPISEAKPKSMMDAFESYFQSSVVKAPAHDLCSKPAENALQRILDQIAEPEGPTTVPQDDETDTIDENKILQKRTSRSAVFPDKLHDMLEYCEANGLDRICRWELQGRAFRILSIELFTLHVMPKFFKLTKFESLQRQLNLYGFTRIARGPMKGCYYHPLVVRGGRSLSKDMQRRKTEDVCSWTTPPVQGAIRKKRSLPPSSNESMFFPKRQDLSNIPFVESRKLDPNSDDDLDEMARDCFGSSSVVSIPASTPSLVDNSSVPPYLTQLSQQRGQQPNTNNSIPSNINDGWAYDYAPQMF